MRLGIETNQGIEKRRIIHRFIQQALAEHWKVHMKSGNPSGGKILVHQAGTILDIF
jgi:hypothetical protein